MRRILGLLWCIFFLFGIINVSAESGINYDDPEFLATVNMLSMDGHGLDDYSSCSVKQQYYEDVAAMFNKGMTKDEILNYYVKELGVHALLAPPGKGFNLTLWVTPFLLLLVTSILVFFLVKKWKENGSSLRIEENTPGKGLEDDIYLSLIEGERNKMK